jgi:hypothetical protein
MPALSAAPLTCGIRATGAGIAEGIGTAGPGLAVTTGLSDICAGTSCDTGVAATTGVTGVCVVVAIAGIEGRGFAATGTGFGGSTGAGLGRRTGAGFDGGCVTGCNNRGWEGTT